MFALGLLVSVLLFLHSLLGRFPSAALGAIVIYAAVRLVDVTGFRRLAAFRRNELRLAVAALIGVLAFGILYGILVAVGPSVMVMMARVARPHDAILGQVPGMAGMHDTSRPRGRSRAWSSTGTTPRCSSPTPPTSSAVHWPPRMRVGSGVHWFVLNVEANVEVDFTGLKALDELRTERGGRGIVFALARVKQDLLDDLRAFGLADAIGDGLLFPTLPTAVAAFERWSDEHPPPDGPVKAS
ncbi:Probable sulfate transporter Rv1739c/MT1781 [Actinomadura madurae]|nr:Probable sulfate transporter Rv1739c/MT1781 [Actinomadura madurae]